MLIAQKFVFVHQPKTGGTFVRDVLAEIEQQHKNQFTSRILARVGINLNSFAIENTAAYHDTCREIPIGHQHKPMLSVVQNPFDFYVSFYHFGWWASHPEESYNDLGPVKHRFPRFPDLSFPEFLDLATTEFLDYGLLGDHRPGTMSPGYYTTQFLIFFCRQPAATYRKIRDRSLEVDDLRKDMFDVYFMRTETLGRDLFNYLSRCGYPSTLINGIPLRERVRPDEQLWERPRREYKSYYDRQLLELILRKDRLLFSLFPEFVKTI